MNEQEIFLRALAENEDDTPTRLVYADWLDDHGEHEEADRQRKWPAAKEWLVQFCRVHNGLDEIDPFEENPSEWIISYNDLIQLGRSAVEEAGEYGIGFSCGSNMSMSEELTIHRHEFWKNWSVVTGIPLLPDAAEKSHFSCAC